MNRLACLFVLFALLTFSAAYSGKADAKENNHARSAARKAISKYRQTSKEIPKTNMKKAPREKAPRAKDIDPSFEVSYEWFYVNRVHRGILDAAVELKTKNNSTTTVKLTNLVSALHSANQAPKLPASVPVKAANGAMILVPAEASKKICANFINRVLEDAETNAERDMMIYASENPKNVEAGNALIKVMFKKIYGNEKAHAEQKAFARIEKHMNVPIGSIYKQYVEGVPYPRLPTKEPNPKYVLEEDNKRAEVKSTYKAINTMDLSSEQEIPEAIRLALNRKLRTESKTKEEEANKSVLKKFFLGN